MDYKKAPQAESRQEHIMTNCVNGELKPGDLVLSSPAHDYACLVGTVLAVHKAGTSIHSKEADAVSVNFSDAGYSQTRFTEIAEMLGELYGRPTTTGTLPPVDFENVAISPDSLIRITGLGRLLLDKVLDDRTAAEGLYKVVELGFPSKNQREQTGIGAEKPSVLAQLRTAEKAPKAPREDPPGKDRRNPER